MPESKGKRVRRYIDKTGGVSPPVARLKGDASTRSFYRVKYNKGTAVLMVLPEPQRDDELPFINIRNHLAECGVSVPEVYDYDKGLGILLLEDFGDVTLQEKLRGASASCYEQYYRTAIDELLKIQIPCTTIPRDCVAFELAFDTEKLMQEMEFFLRHAVEGLYRAKLAPEEKDTLRSGFEAICAEIASFPRVLNHRDYHSRNLMVMDGSIKVVDFQDARMGPCQYDLVSLLRDSYTVLEKPFRKKMIIYYLQMSRGFGIEWADPDEFQYRFELTGLQRNLKACGTFGFMAVEMADDSYIKYLEPTFRYIKQSRLDHKPMGEIVKILSKYVRFLL